MKILIVEDNFMCRKLLHKMLLPYGDCDVAVNGAEAIDVFNQALDENDPYDLVCLDIMMPAVDGRTVLRVMRKTLDEKSPLWQDRTKIIMTSALGDKGNIIASAHDKCDAYLVKPIDPANLQEKLKSLGLLT